MQTTLTRDNPFGFNSKGLLWEYLRSARADVLLDFGAHDGEMLKILAEAGRIKRGVGVDANLDVVEVNASKLPESVSLKHIHVRAPLDFPAKSFDAVMICGVLEHIHDQGHVLRELHRVLKDEGFLVLQVPGKHIFSFLDMGNWKFSFPRLHRIFYELKYTKEQYHIRYVECRNGLIGDIEKEKSWHEHFSDDELKGLLARYGFEVQLRDGAGFFMRPLIFAKYFSPKPLRRFLADAIQWDLKHFARAEVFVIARKIHSAAPVADVAAVAGDATRAPEL